MSLPKTNAPTRFSSRTGQNRWFCLLLPLVAALFACQPTPSPQPEKMPALQHAQSSLTACEREPSKREREDLFHQVRRPKHDYLLVIDDALSMASEQAQARQNMQSFIGGMLRYNQDSHIGVISMDVSNTRFPAGCLRGGFVTGRTPNPVARFLVNARVGTHPSAIPQGFEAAKLALSPERLNDPRCNKGFLRPEAKLSIFFISDKDDQSPAPFEVYRSFFQQQKRDHTTQLSISAVTIPPGGSHANPRIRCLNRQLVKTGQRYWSMAKAFSGAREFICGSLWTIVPWGAYAYEQCRGCRMRFHLRAQALPESITVKVRGRVILPDVYDGWQYDANARVINFSSSQTPPFGARIQVRYRTPCFAARKR